MAALKAHEAGLKRLGARRLYLFGSLCGGEARDTSDADLFFTKKENSGFSPDGLQEYTSRVLGLAADAMTRDSIHKVLRPHIEATALRVF
jgi:predicted nucleotidyltransferase